LKKVFHPELEKILHELWYRFRFLSLYILIGILSLFLELTLRSQLQFLGFHVYLATALSLILGILFAFFGNTYFNFRIPSARRNRALLYFFTISLFSGVLQLSISQVFDELNLKYDQGRLLISGCLFMVAYILHRRYSFRDFKQVGVAIYANGVEDLQNIHSKIGQYPDFIHVDIVDKSFSPDVQDNKIYRMETIHALWQDLEIHTHIMSKVPSRWISEVLPYSDLVFIHWECEEQIETIIKQIQQAGKKVGIALCMGSEPTLIESHLKNLDAVLLLTIPEPGRSGQKFDVDGLQYIEKLNAMPFRKNIRICVDGGVNEKIAPQLKVEDVVSGSSVLNHCDPKGQILCLQTAGRYESV
jgi:pentose-5-phosphate-3-epimerase/putative flippase GtrA